MADEHGAFFQSLYEEPIAGTTGNFDAVASKVVAKLGSTLVSGDQALQALMINHVTASPENAQKGRKISAALAGIKQRSIEAFTAAYPGITLDSLVAEAQKAGYEVEILGS